VRSLTAVITALNEQVASLQEQVEAHFGRHPDAEIYRSQPGIGAITGARVPGESGDDPHRYATAKNRGNYAGTSPITRASGKKKIVAARFVRNDRLIDAPMMQAFAALRVSPGARAFYDHQRASGREHNEALRRLASRLVGILHGCLKTRTCYDEATAWGHRGNPLNLKPPLDIQTTGMSWLPKNGVHGARINPSSPGRPQSNPPKAVLLSG
jgi:Transposase IS116/IS110/IS902 family